MTSVANKSLWVTILYSVQRVEKPGINTATSYFGPLSCRNESVVPQLNLLSWVAPGPFLAHEAGDKMYTSETLGLYQTIPCHIQYSLRKIELTCVPAPRPWLSSPSLESQPASCPSEIECIASVPVLLC